MTEIIEKTVIHTQHHLRFISQKTRLDNGLVMDKGYLEHPQSVGIVPTTAQHQVVLIKQFRIAANDWLLEIPAGTIEAGEDPATCAKRELQEEAGYLPNQLTKLSNFYLSPGSSTELMHLFWAQDLHPSKLEADPDEIIEVVEIPLAQASRYIQSGEIRDAKTILGLLQIQQILKSV